MIDIQALLSKITEYGWYNRGLIDLVEANEHTEVGKFCIVSAAIPRADEFPPLNGWPSGWSSSRFSGEEVDVIYWYKWLDTPDVLSPIQFAVYDGAVAMGVACFTYDEAKAVERADMQ